MILRSTIHSCTAAPRSPKVGSWAGGGQAGRPRRSPRWPTVVGCRGLEGWRGRVADKVSRSSPRTGSAAFCAADHRGRRHGGGLQGLVPGQDGGSSAFRGAEPRCVGLAAPFSDVTKLVLFSLGNVNIFYEPHCIWQSLAFVFCGSQRQLSDEIFAVFLVMVGSRGRFSFRTEKLDSH